ncbi:hypothetical protein [Nostoc sp. TCL26-01]|nr:hypothetical protein [Nostoc sp. TCL26-01]
MSTTMLHLRTSGDEIDVGNGVIPISFKCETVETLQCNVST